MTLDELREVLDRGDSVNRVIAAGLRMAVASVDDDAAHDLGLPSLDVAATGFEAAFAEYRTAMARTLAQALVGEQDERDAAVRALLGAACALWRTPTVTDGDDRPGDPRWHELLDAITAVRKHYPEGGR